MFTRQGATALRNISRKSPPQPTVLVSDLPLLRLKQIKRALKKAIPTAQEDQAPLKPPPPPIPTSPFLHILSFPPRFEAARIPRGI